MVTFVFGCSCSCFGSEEIGADVGETGCVIVVSTVGFVVA